MLLKNILLVALGGAAGSIVRYVSQLYMHQAFPHSFPFGTFTVNIVGCFLIGIISGLMLRTHTVSPDWGLLLTTGFCGGFTTFSAFALDNITLLRNGQLIYFILYTAGSVALGILATWFGLTITK
jgi:CrcB protein